MGREIEPEKSPRARVSFSNYHTTPEGDLLASTTADKLEPGDVVTEHHMLLVVTTHWTPGWDNGDEVSRAWINHCVVLNPGDPEVRGLVGNLMYDSSHGRQAHWNRQGNSRASVRVLLAGPTYEKACALYNDLRPNLHLAHYGIHPQAREDASALPVQATLPLEV